MDTRIAAVLQRARRRLADTSDSPALDARRLLEHRLGVGAAALIVHGRREIDARRLAGFEALVERRAAGEPLAYLTGRAGFWCLDLAVSPAVLIPRPDTETLVETALDRLPDAAADIADLGTGSGAIALAVAYARPHWRVLATDSSHAALACARANARRLGLANIAFARGDWLEALGGARFDALLANPPYIAPGDVALQTPELRHEPQTALVAPGDGLADLARIAGHAPTALKPGGWLLLEHGADQGARVCHMLANARFTKVETVRDLGGRDRVTLGCIASARA